MNGRAFLDTNVLIYAAVPSDPRSVTAWALLETGGAISVQQLNEFVNVAQRKFRKPWNEIVERLQDIRDLCCEPIPITVEIHQKALTIAQRYGCHIFDALSLAAALAGACETFYSEDLQDGQVIDGLTICNPF